MIITSRLIWFQFVPITPTIFLIVSWVLRRFCYYVHMNKDASPNTVRFAAILLGVAACFIPVAPILIWAWIMYQYSLWFRLSMILVSIVAIPFSFLIMLGGIDNGGLGLGQYITGLIAGAALFAPFLYTLIWPKGRNPT